MIASMGTKDRYWCPVLTPNEVISHARLVSLMAQNGATGAVFHVLGHIPEECEDLYTVLVDGRLVVEFEVPRLPGSAAVEQFKATALKEYRDALGQGKRRLRLDWATEDARKQLGAAARRRQR